MQQVNRTSQPRPRPLVVAGCAAWIHEPLATRLDIGVVLCPALGRDERCTHWPLALLAERLVALGFVVLRFDLPGFGDSPDAPVDADAVPHWIEAAKSAGARLRSDYGLARLAFGGLRFGATLAYLSAGEGDVLLLLAPIASGRSWLSRTAFSAGRGRVKNYEEGRGLDAEGVILSPATCASLSAINLATDRHRLPAILFAAPGRASDALAAALQSRCDDFERIAFPGYDALFLDPNDNEAPEDLFADVAERLSKRAKPTAQGAGPAFSPALLSGRGWLERWVRFGPDLEGNLTEPDLRHVSPPQGVIFFNPGGDPRAGIGRFAATACRALATEGFHCLRFDFAGIGDSPAPPGVRRVHVYETPRAAEVDAAVQELKSRGVGRISVVGVSAGGYHAMQAALNHPEVQGAFCISTLKLVWRTGDLLSIGAPRWGRRTTDYVRALFQASTWVRAVNGEVQVLAVLSTLAGRLRALVKPESSSRESRDLMRRIRAAAERGVRIHFLIGTEDAALEEIEAHFGRGGARFTRLAGMSLTLLSGLDHGLVYRSSRAMASDELIKWLKAGAVLDGCVLTSGEEPGVRQEPPTTATTGPSLAAAAQ